MEVPGSISGGHCAARTSGPHLAARRCVASPIRMPSPGAVALRALRVEGSPAGAHAHLSRAGAEHRLRSRGAASAQARRPMRVCLCGEKMAAKGDAA